MSGLKHMDVASRNQRLRETLEGMGLFVLPIFCESDPTRIDYMQVSVDLPTHVRQGVAEFTSSPSIAEMVASSNIGGNIPATNGAWNNVIDLPTKR